MESDGTVTWLTPTILQIACKVKVRFFPFDFQRCNISMASWRYDQSKINMTAINDADSNQFVYEENGVWNLYKTSAFGEERYYNCCGNPYSFVIVEIILKRKPEFYVYTILIPCVLLSVMVIFVFRLPPQSGEKISLGMSNVLALILFQQLIAENMPPLGDETPILGNYCNSLHTIIDKMQNET